MRFIKKFKSAIAITLGILFFTVFTGYRFAAVPSEFTEQVSIYPGATIISSLDLPEGNNVVLDTNGTFTEIHDYYINEMKKDGWSVLKQRDNFMAFSKDDKGVMIDVDSSLKEKSRVTISYLEQV